MNVLPFPIRIYSFEIFHRASPGSSLVYDPSTTKNNLYLFYSVHRLGHSSVLHHGSKPSLELAGVGGRPLSLPIHFWPLLHTRISTMAHLQRRGGSSFQGMVTFNFLVYLLLYKLFKGNTTLLAKVSTYHREILNIFFVVEVF